MQCVIYNYELNQDYSTRQNCVRMEVVFYERDFDINQLTPGSVVTFGAPDTSLNSIIFNSSAFSMSVPSLTNHQNAIFADYKDRKIGRIEIQRLNVQRQPPQFFQQATPFQVIELTLG